MKPVSFFLFVGLAMTVAGRLVAADANKAPKVPKISYGDNAAVGSFADVNGIRLYHESYGAGSPLLVIHGNSGSIKDLAAQIRFFAAHYRVVAADSRGHGKSELGAGPLNFEQMAEDLNALLDRLNLKSVRVLGCSDGGIVGLLLAIHHPEKVDQLVIMGANLDPSAAYDWALSWAERQAAPVDQALAAGDKSRDWATARQKLDLLLKQPNIPITDLAKIKAPTLVMAGDKDVIRPEHTLKIFNALPKAHLAILPGSTHFAPAEEPDEFNRIVDRFFQRPFTRPETSDLIR